MITKGSIRYAAAAGLISLGLFANQSRANTILTFGDSHELGFVNAGIPAGDADVTGYVSQLIGMGLNASTSVGGNSFDRSGHSFSPLDPPVLVLPRGTYSQFQNFQTDPTTLTLTLGTGYEYLLAKYDGPNSGSEVWYVGNLTGSVTIPTFNGQFGISGTSFFTPGTGVPEGCATAGLLCFGLLAIESVRRRTTSRPVRP